MGKTFGVEFLDENLDGIVNYRHETCASDVGNQSISPSCRNKVIRPTSLVNNNKQTEKLMLVGVDILMEKKEKECAADKSNGVTSHESQNVGAGDNSRASLFQ